MNRLLIFTTIVAVALLTGCKKEETNPNISEVPPPTTASAAPGATGTAPAPGAPGAPGAPANGAGPGVAAPGVGAVPGQ